MIGCKGICDRLKSCKPFGYPFTTHAYCVRCVVWIKINNLHKNKCACCNFKPRTESHSKRIKKVVYL